jgi:hypothetical protein
MYFAIHGVLYLVIEFFVVFVILHWVRLKKDKATVVVSHSVLRSFYCGCYRNVKVTVAPDIKLYVFLFAELISCYLLDLIFKALMPVDLSVSYKRDSVYIHSIGFLPKQKSAPPKERTEKVNPFIVATQSQSISRYEEKRKHLLPRLVSY